MLLCCYYYLLKTERKSELDVADVSVIIPHYNAAETVGRSIRSVVQQSLSVMELIIIDDHSDDFDALSKTVAEFRGSLPITLLRLDVNSGASDARNAGVKIAKGKYLAFLDSDDVWSLNKIEIQYSLMERKNLHFSGHLYVHDLNKCIMNSEEVISTKKISPIRFALGNPFFTPTVMVRKDGFIKFDIRYRRVDDYKCWLVNVKKDSGVLILIQLAGGFKPAIGSSGLTSSFKIMHESYVVVLNDLYREGDVGLLFFLLSRMIEYFKYPVRILKGRFGNIFAN